LDAECHACGVKARFSNFPWAGCAAARWCVERPLVSFHITIATVRWTVPPGVPRSYRALAGYGHVPHSTLHHRASGRPSMEDKGLRPAVPQTVRRRGYYKVSTKNVRP
jgi:hypothetical protein